MLAAILGIVIGILVVQLVCFWIFCMAFRNFADSLTEILQQTMTCDTKLDNQEMQLQKLQNRISDVSESFLTTDMSTGLYHEDDVPDGCYPLQMFILHHLEQLKANVKNKEEVQRVQDELFSQQQTHRILKTKIYDILKGDTENGSSET